MRRTFLGVILTFLSLFNNEQIYVVVVVVVVIIMTAVNKMQIYRLI